MIYQRVIQEGFIWSSATHPNITPFLGVTFDFDRPGLPCLVLPYYRHGSITAYLKDRPHINKVPLVSHNIGLDKEISGSLSRQITQFADAVSYLHDVSIVHGNLKAVCRLIEYFCLCLAQRA
jgi:serine/threonine protein kinase